MKIKLCDKCPYTPSDLADRYEAHAAIHLCLRCDCESYGDDKYPKLSEFRERLGALTPREQQVMALLCDGRQLREIADELGARAHTISVHSSRIRSKVGARSIPDLMRLSGTLGSVLQELRQKSTPGDLITDPPAT